MPESSALSNSKRGLALRFRPCEAADAPVAVPLIFSSGPATFRYVFAQADEGQALAFLRSAFAQGDGEFGFRNHILASLDQQPVAVAALWGSDASGRFLRAAARQVLAFYGPLRGLLVAWRGLRVEQVLKPPADDAAYLAHVGVEPAYRGRGVGLALMHFLLDQARIRGFRRAVLDVATENPRAIALYRGLGFEVTGTSAARLSSAFGAVPAHHSMALDLERVAASSPTLH